MTMGRLRRALLLVAFAKISSAEIGFSNPPDEKANLRGLLWFGNIEPSSEASDNSIDLIESVPCEPDHSKAVKLVSRFGKVNAGNEACALETDPDSCATGCCRFGSYFLCDTTNSFVDLPCVCGRNTKHASQWHKDKIARDGEGLHEADFLSGWGGEPPDDLEERDGGSPSTSTDISEEATRDGDQPCDEQQGTQTVQVLGLEAWERDVINSPLVTMVAFTAPWCPACQQLHPQYDDAGAQLQGKNVQLIWVDATDVTNADFVRQYDVQSFPKIVIFPAGSPKKVSQAHLYQGAHSAPDIVSAISTELGTSDGSQAPATTSPDANQDPDIVSTILSALGISEGSQAPSTTSPNAKQGEQLAGAVSIQGQDAWDREVINSPLVIVVAFTAPWCPACQNLHPEYDKAAAELDDGVVHLVWVDATDETNANFVGQYDVQGYPKIVIFPAGSPKDSSQAAWYQGAHSAQDIVTAVLLELAISGSGSM